jgi:hypothetical protein
MKVTARALAALSIGLLAAACSQQDQPVGEGGEPNGSLAASGTSNTSRVAPAPQPRSCTASLRAEVDAESFVMGEERSSPSPQQLETLRGDAERLFKSVADRMCAAGELEAAKVAAVQKLLVQFGGGADNTAIYADGESLDENTLVFQYTFLTGDEAKPLGLPDGEDARQGLLCHFARQANEAMCNDRLP